jgi:hypothetical protein
VAAQLVSTRVVLSSIVSLISSVVTPQMALAAGTYFVLYILLKLKQIVSLHELVLGIFCIHIVALFK